MSFLPFSRPSYVKASKSRIRRAYVIEAVGLAGATVYGVVIDGRVALEPYLNTSSLIVLPLSNGISISYEDVLFYASCLGYEHEIPAIALPKRRLFLRQTGVEFLLDKWKRRDVPRTYEEHLVIALDSLISLRFGPLGFVRFRCEKPKLLPAPATPIVRLNYRKKYWGVEKEIHLYSVALRQIDPLFEYLCYFRVIESAIDKQGNKVKSWLAKNLGRLEHARFGMLRTGTVGDPEKDRKTNFFTVLKRRAVSRLKALLATHSYEKVAERFYHINRGGIAHGLKIKRLDYSGDFKEVYLHAFVLKLMARLAIEEKLRAGVGKSKGPKYGLWVGAGEKGSGVFSD